MESEGDASTVELGLDSGADLILTALDRLRWLCPQGSYVGQQTRGSRTGAPMYRVPQSRRQSHMPRPIRVAQVAREGHSGRRARPRASDVNGHGSTNR